MQNASTPAKALSLPLAPVLFCDHPGIDLSKGSYPADIRQLAQAASRHAPAILAGADPDRVGLALVHPEAPGCPELQAAEGHAFAVVLPLGQLQKIAVALDLPTAARPGWFMILLAGKARSARFFAATAERILFERRAS